MRGGILDIITIDFETYYSGEFCAAVMPLQQYILGKPFEVIGVSVQFNDGEPHWFSGSHEQTSEFLRRFPWASSTLVAHNAMFDASILGWIYGLFPKVNFCTSFAAAPFIAPFTEGGKTSLDAVSSFLGLGDKGDEVVKAKGLRRADFSPEQLERYGEYCRNDVALCYRIFKKLCPLFSKDEALVMHMTIEKHTKPQIEIATAPLRKNLTATQQEKEQVLVLAGLKSRSLLMSNNKFALALQSLGVDPPTKTSPTTGKLTFAFAKTDPEMVGLLNHDNPQVSRLAKARIVHKSTAGETRTKRLISLSEVSDTLAVPLRYYGAHTGRYSGSGLINLQNLSRGSLLRHALVAPKGHKFLAGDLSQIEARILATLSGQNDLVEGFREGRDVYCEFASKLHGRTIDSSMKSERLLGKLGILQLGYGAGFTKFHSVIGTEGINVTEARALEIVTNYRNTYPRIPLLWREATRWIRFMVHGDSATHIEYGCLKIYKEWGEYKQPAILLPNGMPMYYPRIYTDANGQFWYTSRIGAKKIYGASMVENVCQALARIVIVRVEIFLHKHNIHTCNQVHDEIHVIVPEHLACKYQRVLELAMCRPIPWMPTLPLACEVGVGNSYADAH